MLWWCEPARTVAIHEKWLVSSIEYTELGTIISQCESLLTSLGSHPVCSGDTSEADVATEGQRRQHLCLWCSVIYTGNGFPVFIWTKSNTEKNITANTTTSDTGRGPITNTSSITQQLRANDSGVTFHCRITFQTPGTSTERAVNDFQYKWNYTLCKQSINDLKWSLLHTHRTFLDLIK